MVEFWELVDIGIGCLLLIVAVVGSYLLGVHSGRVRERNEASRNRIRQNKMTIFQHQRQLEEIRTQVDCLEKERALLTLRSEAYERVQTELDRYHCKIDELEREIQMLSNDTSSIPINAERLGLDIPKMLYSLRKDPLHVNPSKEEWTEIMDMTDLLFNNFLTNLKTRVNITRHEQEICCLIKWDFSRKEQLAVFNNTPDALTKSKGRLKKRLGLDEKTDLDTYIRLL